jgi:hypothetical protein
MTSNLKKTLQGALTLALVLSAVEARAQKLETPGSPATEAAAAPAPSTGGAALGDSGQIVLSIERLFGYDYAHQSNNFHVSAFTVLGNPIGDGASAYDWPRLALDAFVARGFSLGGSVSFFRATLTSGSNPSSSTTGFEVAPRVGYELPLAPGLAFWGRAGVAYVYSNTSITNGASQSGSYVGLTVDPSLAFMFSHLTLMVGPVVDIGLTGTIKYTDVGLFFGFAIPL